MWTGPGQCEVVVAEVAAATASLPLPPGSSCLYMESHRPLTCYVFFFCGVVSCVIFFCVLLDSVVILITVYRLPPRFLCLAPICLFIVTCLPSPVCLFTVTCFLSFICLLHQLSGILHTADSCLFSPVYSHPFIFSYLLCL